MPVLGQDALREAIARGDVIVGGDPSRARGAAYHVRAGKVFPGGTERPEEVIDLSDGGLFLVPPGGLVMVRTREVVRMPSDHGGLWCQVQHLSRLMLLNAASVVEPGYEGPLSCALVNVGRTPARITADDTIAKLYFVPLPPSDEVRHFGALVDSDGDIAQALRAYDREVLERATDAPPVFLDTVALAREAVLRESERLDRRLEASARVASEHLQAARDRATSELEDQAGQAVARVGSEAAAAEKRVEDAASRAHRAELEAFKADVRSFVFRPGLLGAVLVAALAVLWAAVPMVQHWWGIDDYSLTTAEWEDALEQAGERVGIERVDGTHVFLVDDPTAEANAARLDALEARLRALEDAPAPEPPEAPPGE